MKTVSFAFAVHNHQPNGNFDSVFEEAYRNAYKPFIDILAKHPGVKFTQHWTGTLLEWLYSRHPEFIREMKQLVRKGQLELLTGSYYEAILAVIPEEDRIGQIRKLSETIEGMFGCVPRGMWLAERVWEQHLARSIALAGVEFVVIDDTHFRQAGLNDEQLLGYYVTEEQGATLKLVPIDKTLRYMVPFRAIDDTRHYLQGIASEHGERMAVHGDDGEKFGVWPKTYASVYDQGWLESFCEFLEKERSWVATIHVAEFLDSRPPLGRVYLPAASYPEMMKWVLPPTSFLDLERFEEHLEKNDLRDERDMFVRGGYWRNFLSKYPEANHMHKKMLRISNRALALSARRRVSKEIFDHIWAGQCNDAYWHGVFGGLYLPNLRFPVYRHLLKAETALDRLEHPDPIQIETTDFDCDGSEEILLESSPLNLYFTPSVGGSLVELDYKPAHFNLLDIVSRREEGYHRRLLANRTIHSDIGEEELMVKELGLEKHLNFDWYRHASLVDHFFADETSLESVQQCKFLEEGDFVNQPYRWTLRRRGRVGEIVLTRDGAVWQRSVRHPVAVKKAVTYRAGEESFSVDYEIRNQDKKPVDIWFGIEMNVGLMAGEAHDRYYEIKGRTLSDQRLRSTGEEEAVEEVRLVDEWLGIETSFMTKQPATLWRCPIETVSLSEAGLERLYQSSMLIFHWKVHLEDVFTTGIVQSIHSLQPKPGLQKRPVRQRSRRK